MIYDVSAALSYNHATRRHSLAPTPTKSHQPIRLHTDVIGIYLDHTEKSIPYDD
jgi:hypothetical protein